MRLLVSVESGEEAVRALEGGADLIDAKDPRRGALGAVSVETLQEIYASVAGRRPVTAALGDATDKSEVERLAYDFARIGAEFVKVGFAGITSTERVLALTEAAVRGANSGRSGAGVVAVAYADANRVGSISPKALIRIAGATGVMGVLVDTADKNGPGLRNWVEPATIAGWISKLHATGLFLALAGKLNLEDLDFVREGGTDIVGVRGAACEGGRVGRVVAERVRRLKERSAVPLTTV